MKLDNGEGFWAVMWLMANDLLGAIMDEAGKQRARWVCTKGLRKALKKLRQLNTYLESYNENYNMGEPIELPLDDDIAKVEAELRELEETSRRDAAAQRKAREEVGHGLDG